MALTKIQTKMAKLWLLDAYNDWSVQDHNDLAPLLDIILEKFGGVVPHHNDLAPLLDIILEKFGGVVPQAVQCIEFYTNDGVNYRPTSCESTPYAVRDSLSVNSQQQGGLEVQLPGLGYGIGRWGQSEDLGTWLYAEIGCPGSPGVDGGVIFTNNPAMLIGHFGKSVVAPTEYKE